MEIYYKKEFVSDQSIVEGYIIRIDDESIYEAVTAYGESFSETYKSAITGYEDDKNCKVYWVSVTFINSEIHCISGKEVVTSEKQSNQI